MISTQDLSLLPDIDRLKSVMQSMAMLDAIFDPQWGYDIGTYSFYCKWDTQYACGVMRDYSGDEFFAGFSTDGAIIKGFAHESQMSPYANAYNGYKVWPGVLDEVPSVFSSFLAFPGVMAENTTFCVWRTYQDSAWQRGRIDFPADYAYGDGSADLLSILDGDPRTYLQFAEDYYEREIDLEIVRYIYDHQPLTAEIIQKLNPQVALDDLAEDRDQIGY